MNYSNDVVSFENIEQEIIAYNDPAFLIAHAEVLKKEMEKQRIKIILMESVVKQLQNRLKNEKKSGETE